MSHNGSWLWMRKLSKSHLQLPISAPIPLFKAEFIGSNSDEHNLESGDCHWLNSCSLYLKTKPPTINQWIHQTTFTSCLPSSTSHRGLFYRSPSPLRRPACWRRLWTRPSEGSWFHRTWIGPMISTKRCAVVFPGAITSFQPSNHNIGACPLAGSDYYASFQR